MNRDTYRALCQIIGEYYLDAMRKDEALQEAMRELCRLSDALRPRPRPERSWRPRKWRRF